jgi:HK97 gp10 family phage protein
MPMPPSVTRVTANGVEYTSSVDRVKYTIEELTRAALRDCAKLIRKRLIQQLKTMPGMKRSKRLYKSTQYWVRRRESDLQIGFKHDAWYGARSELGTHGSPARGLLRSTVYNNIPEIRMIQSKYLSGVSAENPSLAGTSEDDYESPEGEES